MTIVVHGYSTSVTADTNILATNFSSGYKKEDYSIVYLWVTFQNEGVLTLVRKNGATEYDEILNSGCALQAGCAYIFPIMLTEEELNFKYSANSTLTYYQMREMY